MASNFRSSIHRGGDYIHDFACSPCEEDGLNTEAQHFCSKCTTYYCDNCVTKHNVLYKRHSVLDRNDVKKWTTAIGTVDALERCERHSGKALELVCDDHDQLCCHVCVAVDHRLCSSIQHIPDVAKGIRKDPIFTQLSQKVADLRKQLEDRKAIRKENAASLRKTRGAIVDEIKTTRKKITDILDRMEKKTVQELDDLIAKNESSIKKDIDLCTQMHEDLKSLMDVIENKKSSGEPALYIGFRKCGDKINEAQELVRRLTVVETCTVAYQADKAIEEWFTSLQSFGVSTESVSVVEQFQPEHVFQVLGFNEYNVKMSSDEDDCDIMGVCELPDGHVVITDGNNCKVKLLDKEYRVVDHCDLPEYPWDLCHIDGNEVAVCVNYAVNNCGDEDAGDDDNGVAAGDDNDGDIHELHFINATQGKLVTTRKLSFTHECYAAAHRWNNLYISSGTELYVYTMSGQLIAKL